MTIWKYPLTTCSAVIPRPLFAEYGCAHPEDWQCPRCKPFREDYNLKPFTPGKVIKRTTIIRACDRALPNTEWVLAMDSMGCRIRKMGASKDSQMYLSWRSIISHALIHKQLK